MGLKVASSLKVSSLPLGNISTKIGDMFDGYKEGESHSQ